MPTPGQAEDAASQEQSLHAPSEQWGVVEGQRQVGRGSAESQAIASERRNKDPRAAWWSSHAMLQESLTCGAAQWVSKALSTPDVFLRGKTGRRTEFYKGARLMTECLNELDLEKDANSPPKHLHAQ